MTFPQSRHSARTAPINDLLNQCFPSAASVANVLRICVSTVRLTPPVFSSTILLALCHRPSCLELSRNSCPLHVNATGAQSAPRSPTSPGLRSAPRHAGAARDTRSRLERPSIVMCSRPVPSASGHASISSRISRARSRYRFIATPSTTQAAPSQTARHCGACDRMSSRSVGSRAGGPARRLGVYTAGKGGEASTRAFGESAVTIA